MVPALCPGFLIVSMIHFGSGDARHATGWMRGVEIVAHGGLVVAISQMHRPEVDVVFGYLWGRYVSGVERADVMTVLSALRS